MRTPTGTLNIAVPRPMPANIRPKKVSDALSAASLKGADEADEGDEVPTERPVAALRLLCAIFPISWRIIIGTTVAVMPFAVSIDMLGRWHENQ